MKKVDIERIFNKLSLQVRSTGHNYGWLTVSDKKISGFIIRTEKAICPTG